MGFDGDVVARNVSRCLGHVAEGDSVELRITFTVSSPNGSINLINQP